MKNLDDNVQSAIVASYFNGVEDAVAEFAPEASHECVNTFMQTKLTEWNEALVECEKQNAKAARKNMIITLGIAVGIIALPIVIDAIGKKLEKKRREELYKEYEEE